MSDMDVNNIEINDLNHKINDLKNKKHIFKNILKTLKIGDTVYEEQLRWIEFEYHPQIIKQIDTKNCKILIFEESINVQKWINKFYLYNKVKDTFEYYGI